MADLTTRWLGLTLPTPLVVASSPLTHDADAIAAAVSAGAGAVIMHSVFEEQLVADQMAAHHFVDARVDVDAEAGSFRVVDYKIRRNQGLANVAKKVAAGETHQLPFYAELAGAALGGKDWEFDGAELLFLETKDDEERSETMSAADWKAARARFLELVGERVGAIAAGRFPIRPDEGDHGVCSRCEFPTVCRKAHAPARVRALRVPVPGEAQP